MMTGWRRLWLWLLSLIGDDRLFMERHFDRHGTIPPGRYEMYGPFHIHGQNIVLEDIHITFRGGFRGPGFWLEDGKR